MYKMKCIGCEKIVRADLKELKDLKICPHCGQKLVLVIG